MQCCDVVAVIRHIILPIPTHSAHTAARRVISATASQKMAKAASAIRQLRGGMLPFPEAFMAFITTQSEEAPAGVFADELQKARDIRDGKRWQTVEDLDPETGANLKLLPAASGAAAVERIVLEGRSDRDKSP